jgi:hypothetical protein
MVNNNSGAIPSNSTLHPALGVCLLFLVLHLFCILFTLFCIRLVDVAVSLIVTHLEYESRRHEKE